MLALTKAGTDYVQEYEATLSYLIGTETYTQRKTVSTLPFGVLGSVTTTETTRVLRSELFLTFVPATREWIAVRDIAAQVMRDIMMH